MIYAAPVIRQLTKYTLEVSGVYFKGDFIDDFEVFTCW